MLRSKEVDTVDHESKCLVFGYIKRSQKLLPSTTEDNNNAFYTISNLIIYIILSYYYDCDQFDSDLCGEGINISNNNKMIDNKNINHIRYSHGSRYRTVYGSNIISSTIKDKRYKWRIKTVGVATRGLYIGIDSTFSIKNRLNECFAHQRNSRHFDDHDLDDSDDGVFYAYRCSTGTILTGDDRLPREGFCEFKAKGDILSISLSFDEDGKGKLVYCINNDNDKKFILSDNIYKNIGLNYRLAITMCDNSYGNDICLQLL